MKFRPLLLIVTGALAASLALPQDYPQGQPSAAPGSGEGDVPGRAARLSVVSGNVSFQPGSVDDWIPATLNRPLTTSDRLWTEAGARAEVHLGSAAMRLNGRTNFSFINLNDRVAQVQLSLGSLSVRVRRLDPDEIVEVDTPQVALTLLQPGEYRIDVNEQGDTTVATVRSGAAEANSGQVFNIEARQQVRITGGGDNGAPAFDQRNMPPGDSFDNWCQDRDRREDMSQSSRYVSRDMPGYADLDAAGTWRQDPQYGAVWMPTSMGPDWAPYRTGHWAWIGPWGWTWVDDAPWGYAPFHYGRWAYMGQGWGWIPGPVTVSVRPVYAPALVAWVGGPSFGVAIGGGAGVGWFALGPREVYVPSYRYSARYIERVNVTNTVIVNRGVFANVERANVSYANRGIRGAVVAVPNGAFVSGRRVSEVAVRIRPEQIERVQVTTYSGVAPQREAVLGGRASVSYRPPAVAVTRTVVTRATPPAPRIDFAHEREAIQNNQGRPLDRDGYNRVRQDYHPQPQVNYRPAVPQGAVQGGQQGRPQNPRDFSRGTTPVNQGQPASTPRPEIRENRVPPPTPATTTTPASPTIPNARPMERRERPVERPTTTTPPPVRTMERPAATPHTEAPQHQQTHPERKREEKHEEKKPEKDTKKP